MDGDRPSVTSHVSGGSTSTGGGSWRSAHCVARGSAARASRTSAASSSRLASRSATRAPQGHEFEITMSVEADVPAVWECPRCGAEALSTAGIQPRGEGREAGPHALGHAAGASLGEGARGHPQGAPRAAARRRDRPGAPAPRQRQEAQGSTPAGLGRQVSAGCAGARRPAKRTGSVDHVALDHGPLTGPGAGATRAVRTDRPPAAAPRRAASSRRATGRVNGRISRTPSSVGDEAGGEHQRAADQDQRAVGELAWPASGRVRGPRAAPARPGRPRAGSARRPSMLSSTSSRIVHQAPITWPTWMSDVDLHQRHHHEREDEHPPATAVRRRVIGAASASRQPAAHLRAALGAAPTR